jgi:zinc and cadmium transporter
VIESSLGLVIILGLLSSLGALLPAGILLCIPDSWRRSCIPYLLSYATGSMLAAAILGLIPEALERAPARQIGVALLSGLVLFFVLEWSVLWQHSHEEKHVHAHQERPAQGTRQAGILVLLGDAVHNFADGIAIGTSCLASPSLGITTTVAIMGHEIPQELSDFSILLSGGYTRWQAVAWNGVSGLGTLVGAVLSYAGLGYVTTAVPYILGVAAASFLYIGLADLVPSIHGRIGAAKGAWQFVMMIAGMVVIGMLHP